ncbi:PH domain-containing protein [Nocardia arthritidis]|uniref:PH domain-containing protein n=1 Tax=Nocardia arthritidis TaxID=228602 RepID=A0A6G9YQB9_9NOCA|nr:PH domain-containing protein [Nocardia arthritidis]QIS15402.1 PH domain-containing protein [Nocardia arthritidis]
MTQVLPWQRLDPRMLLVHPVNEVVRYIPVLIGTVIVGSRADNPLWSLIPLVLIVGFAATRWFTTTYRVGPTHVELRTGLIQRKRLAVPRSRIRSVDIEADLLHRALGLAVLAIGTGQHADKKEQFKLDALDARLVPDLRRELLASTGTEEVAGQEVPKIEPAGREIGHWQAGWVRYAPLSLTGFAIFAPIVGLAFQYGIGQAIFRSDAVHSLRDGTALVITLVIAALVVALVLVVALAACARYLATYFGLQVLDDGKTLQIRHGLFTTRQITMDLARFRGATVNEPLLLRLAGGAELEAIMTGEKPRVKILPQAPRAAIDHTLAHLLAPDATHDKPSGTTQSMPGLVPLIPHGPAALRRRYTRTLLPVLVIAVVMLAIRLAGVEFSAWWWLIPVLGALIGIPLAADRYRGLGHAVIPADGAAPTWLVTRSGSLDRDRDCLEAPGIIGWTVRQTFFQRRAGVATVVAATAAGKKRYAVIDIPIDQAYALIEQVHPGRLGKR